MQGLLTSKIVLVNPFFKWDGTVPGVSCHHILGCQVYANIHRNLGTLGAWGGEMRYLGFSPNPTFHHLYWSRDRRVFTTKGVTFVVTDIQVPDCSENVWSLQRYY